MTKPAKTATGLSNNGLRTIIFGVIGLVVLGMLSSRDIPRDQSSVAAPIAQPQPTVIAPPRAGEDVPEAYFQQVKRDAYSPCSRAVENSARYDFRWASGWLTSRFSRWNRYQRADGVLTFTGDEAEAQNGFGNWMRVTYRCEFNPATGKVVNVTLTQGRLPTSNP